MNGYLEKVGDVFGVEQRLREIDGGYRVFYNKLKNRYEVHNIKLKPNTLVLVCPFDELDCRLIRLVRKTRVERAGELFREMEEENEKLYKKQAEEKIEKAKYLASLKLQKMKNILEGGEK